MITKNIDGNNISQAFIDEIRSDSPSTNARLMLDGEEISCDIVKIVVEKGSCGDYVFIIGSVMADMLVATVKNLDVDLKGKEIEYQVGALVNGSYEYISLGRFIVSQVKKTRYQQEITAYSGIVGKSKDVLTSFITDPPTLGMIASKVAGQMNCLVKFDEGIDTSLNIGVPFDDGSTVYNAIEVLALCCGGYAINDNEGNIHIKQFGMERNLDVDTGMMTKLPEISEQPFVIDSVSVQVADATYDDNGQPVDRIYISRMIRRLATENGEEFVTESGSYLVAAINTDNAVLQLSNKYVTPEIFKFNIEPIIGYEYYPANIHLTLGDPRVEGCDVLAVEEVDGSVYTVPCHKITHTYKTAFVTDIRSAEATDMANDIGTSLPITMRISNLERKSDSTKKTAKSAIKIAGDTNQYFWFMGEGTDTGAHITETPQEQFLSDPVNGGGNLLARSNGIAIRDGLEELASFSAGQLRIGMEDDASIIITPRVTDFYGNRGALVGQISSDQLVTGAYIQNLHIKDSSEGYDLYNRHIWLDTEIPFKIYETNLKYEPESDIEASIELYSGGRVTNTVDYTIDSDTTVDGLRAVYEHLSRKITIYWNGALPSNSDYRLRYVVPEYKGRWEVPSYTYNDRVQHYAGDMEYSVTQYSLRRMKLNRQPVYWTGSTDVMVHVTTASPGNNPHLESAIAYFAYNTSETQVEEFYTYDGPTGRYATITYNASTLEITADYNIYEIEYHIKDFFRLSNYDTGSFVYDREFYAPQFEFGINNDVGQNGCTTLFGEGLISSAMHQVVVGKFNVASPNYSFIVGNGEDEDYRHNGLTVNWNGSVASSGTISQSSDRRLKEHIDYLDDDAVEFIRELKPAHFIKDEEDHIGFYAQDVEKSDKWDCLTGEMNGYMTLSYTELIAPLVRYCQKLEERIKELERREDGEHSDS